MPHPSARRSLPGLLAVLCLMAAPLAAVESTLVRRNADGRLSYVDVPGSQNRIPDFSNAGYGGGGRPLPTAPVVVNVSPGSGDDTQRIQAALDAVGGRAADGQGIRGAVLLAPGIYEVAGTLRLARSGVVLRGSGRGNDPAVHTILRRTINSSASVIILGGGDDNQWRPEVGNSRSDITTPFVQVGSRSVDVANPAKYSVGDNVVVYHPCTQAWLDAIDGGGTASDARWTVGSQPLVFNRTIAAISGSRVTLDAPVFNHLDRALSQSYLYKADRTGMVTHVGVEHLRLENLPPSGVGSDHPDHPIHFLQAEHGWANQVEIINYAKSGFRLATTSRTTLVDCRVAGAKGPREGGQMYAYRMEAAQLILVERCVAEGARHSFVGNGTSWDSGLVFLDCLSRNATHASEGHRRWGMGYLYDGMREESAGIWKNIALCLGNRGDFGTGHGWGIVHSVAWNCHIAPEGGEKITVQKPPTAQNYAIGCIAAAVGASGYFSKPVGHVESTGTPVSPASLYRAQLADRLGGGTSNRSPILDGAPGAQPNPARAGDAVQFSALASDADGDPLSYRWTFGDGATATGRTVSHAYAAAGSYVADVTVSDGRGGSDSATVTVTVTTAGTPPPGGSLPIAGLSASSFQDGNPPSHLTDGSLATRWSAEGDGQWVRVDLGGHRIIDAVALAVFQGDARQAIFELQVSDDGASWRTVFNGRSSGRTTALEPYPLTGADGRFLRLLGHGNTSNAWNSYTELRVHGRADEIALPIAAVTASAAQTGNPPAHAVDRRMDTRWSADGDGQWLRLDLGGLCEITGIALAAYQGDTRQALFDLQASVDGTTWTTLFSGRSSGTSAGLERVAAAHPGARFVRLVGHGNTANSWNSYLEIEVFGIAVVVGSG